MYAYNVTLPWVRLGFSTCLLRHTRSIPPLQERSSLPVSSLCIFGSYACATRTMRGLGLTCSTNTDHAVVLDPLSTNTMYCASMPLTAGRFIAILVDSGGVVGMAEKYNRPSWPYQQSSSSDLPYTTCRYRYLQRVPLMSRQQPRHRTTSKMQKGDRLTSHSTFALSSSSH